MQARSAMPRTSVSFTRPLVSALIGLVCLAASAGACKSDGRASSVESRAPETTIAMATPPTGAPSAGAKPARPGVEPTLVKEAYGQIEGRAVDRYTLKNANGLILRVISYGAIITEFHAPDRTGKLDDIVLGFDALEDYVQASPYFGAVVGRVANRIANARFELDGKEYALAANDAPHHLHGGTRGWDKVVWRAEPLESADGVALKLTHVSPDGEEGYPGTVTATTVYTLTNDDALRVEMSATTDAPTIVNMAHHSYWNLGGHASGSIQGHVLQLFASSYTPGGDTPSDRLIPTGRIAQAAGTPFDFTQPKAIGRELLAAGGTLQGFDHNWVIDGDPHRLRPVARLYDPASGRTLALDADQPGVQFYSGNFLSGKAPGKGGARYARHSGLCLETQKFPNSVNVPEWRDEVLLSPGQSYKHVMVHRFTTDAAARE